MRDTLRQGSRGSDVRRLQTILNTLGATLKVDGDFGDKTFESVYDFQSARGLEPDGIVGPMTWTELDQAMAKHTLQQKAIEGDKLRVAAEEAMKQARTLWQRDIIDPKATDKSEAAETSKTFIDTFIRAGLGWTWEKPYAGDGDFEWCGAFTATCWAAVKPKLRELYFSSTYRLDRYGAYRSAFGEENRGSGRLYAKLDESSTELPFDPLPGDILLIGPSGYGAHICLVERYDAARRVFHTIEGNGVGVGPKGDRRQGVVRGMRMLGGRGWCARRLIRPSEEDLG